MDAKKSIKFLDYLGLVGNPDDLFVPVCTAMYGAIRKTAEVFSPTLHTKDMIVMSTPHPLSYKAPMDDVFSYGGIVRGKPQHCGHVISSIPKEHEPAAAMRIDWKGTEAKYIRSYKPLASAQSLMADFFREHTPELSQFGELFPPQELDALPTRDSMVPLDLRVNVRNKIPSFAFALSYGSKGNRTIK